MFKNVLVSCLLMICFSISMYSQTGPGGVGGSSNNILWLDAGALGLTDNDPVTSWTDLSGNANNGDQAVVSAKPTFRTSQINGLPAIEFDGVDDRSELVSHITTDAITIFSVFNNTSSSYLVPFCVNKHVMVSRNNDISLAYLSPYSLFNIPKTNNSFSIFSANTPAGATSVSLDVSNGSTTTNYTRSTLLTNPGSAVGSNVSSGPTYDYFFQGQIAELIVYNEDLNSASRNIISSSLGAKYNLTPLTSIYGYGSTHGHEVIGIGQESDGSNTTARGPGSIEMSNATTLGDGDYALIGHDNGGFSISTSVPTGIVERWSQVWRMDKTGTPGNVDLEFFLGVSGFSLPDNYVVLIETDDGDFSNGGTSFVGGGVFSGSNISMKFSGVNIPDGAYFTLAEVEADITAVMDGGWKSTSTWSCGCLPTADDIVTIGSTFDVDVDSTARVLNLTISAGGSISFSTTDSLYISGTLDIEGSFSGGTGTVSAVNSIGTNVFTNTSGSNVAFNNLYVNSSGGLELGSGGWSVTNSLRVTAGGMDVTGADSVIMVSDATKTSEILESMTGAFTGNFTLQRYISGRNPNYSAWGSPLETVTVAQLDDDLILSGIFGDDGAIVIGPDTFHSVTYWENPFQVNTKIKSTSYELVQGRGYEIYLAHTSDTFNATTVDFIGVPTSGPLTTNRAIVYQGWNLFGNPYYSHIDYDAITKTIFTPDEYYIFNTDNGSYDFFTGGSKPAIAPFQSFYVNKASPGANYFDFAEDDKVSSNSSSSFLRNKKSNYSTLKISSNTNSFRHELKLDFNPNGVSSLSENDAHYLMSPMKEAPAIYTKASNSDKPLIKKVWNSFEENQLIPISIYSGVEGSYTIEGENIESIYDDYSCIYLKDNLTKEVIDLSVEPSYTFNSEVGNSNRFNLILSNSYTDCQKLIENETINQKLESNLALRNSNGQWFLDYTLGNDNENISVAIYNMNGQLVREEFQFAASGAGYQLLNDLSSLNGIYLIQVKGNGMFLNKTVKL